MIEWLVRGRPQGKDLSNLLIGEVIPGNTKGEWRGEKESEGNNQWMSSRVDSGHLLGSAAGVSGRWCRVYLSVTTMERQGGRWIHPPVLCARLLRAASGGINATVLLTYTGLIGKPADGESRVFEVSSCWCVAVNVTGVGGAL